MSYCPQCLRLVDDAEFAGGDTICPHCQGDDFAEGSAWGNAARVTNLAEGGYLVSLLESEGIDARLVQSDSFDALGGSWRSGYLLQVAQDELERARPLLIEEAAEAEGEESAWGPNGEPLDIEPDPMVIWRPVALMAIAGVATLWYGAAHWNERHPPHRVPSAVDLATAMDSIGEPFVIENGRGTLQHRLWYSAAHKRWFLESDTDNDGRLDRRREFHMQPIERN